MDKHQLAQIFNEIGLLLELKGENPFKTRAYYNAARTIENMTSDLDQLIVEGKLSDIPGFGDAIIKKINEWRQTGTINYYEDLKNSLPGSLLNMLRIPGIGPKKINQLYSTLGIDGIDALEQACIQNRLVGLANFGVKTQAKILAGIQFVKEHQGKFLAFNVWHQAFKIHNDLLNHSGVIKVEIAGSLRRYREIVHDIDLVAAVEDREAASEFFTHLPEVVEVIGRGSTLVSVMLNIGLQVDLRMVTLQEFPHALQHFSGSKEHNTALRHLAKELGYKVNEYGLFDSEGPIYCEDETAIYNLLGLEFIPPELREDLGELTAARNRELPKLIRPEEIQGVFHVHTNYSDGVNSIEEMVEMAISRGFSYLGISDHSRTAVYAHGLTEDALVRQHEEIERLKLKYPNFTILKGIEADILPSGELDYSPEILSRFDFVIGSIHSQFQMSREEMTNRILKALDNPYLTILGHPTGRILLERNGYEVDLDRVLAKAASQKVVVEFNASPYRLDLDWRWCRTAKELGVLIAINPDAHSVSEIDLTRISLAIARKGWLEVKDVLNTKDSKTIKTYLMEQKRKF